MFTRFFGSKKSNNAKSQTTKSRKLRMESLESRELLSVTPLEYAGIRELYSSFELSENMSEVNVIDLNAATTSAQVQAALDAAKATPQDDLLVMRVDAENHTLTLDGNPLVVDVAPENGGVYIVALADDGSNVSLTVDTQHMSRAFSILRGEVGLANMDVYGRTWSFDEGSAYDGLIRVRNVADLTVENVEIWAAPAVSDSPVMGGEETQGLPGELLIPNADWILAEPSSDVAVSVDGAPTSVSVSAPSAEVAEGPYGAGQYDTSLYMAGNVVVTLAIMESNGAIDASRCNWSTSQINMVKTKAREALDWWETMFDKYNPNSPIGLSFTIDYTDATTPFQTSYEPIMHAGSSEEDLWGCEYLASKGYAATDSTYWNTMCSYNADIRNKTGADWAYTILVVHSRDPQGNLVGSTSIPGDFAGGGAGAYAWGGGANMLVSYDCRGWGINRMNYTFAHETGHIFHAPDEYEGSGSYYDVSGYYGIQNLNAIDDNPNPNACVPSIMNGEQDYAWKNYTSSPTSLQTIGWRDSDGDGLIDALDTPLILTGRGKYDAEQNTFTFTGKSSVTTLENAMTDWWKSDVTLNTIDRLEYKLDNGAWKTLATVSGTSSVSANGAVNMGDAKLISFRTVCDRTGVTSATLTFDPFDNPFNPLDDPLRVTTALDVVDDTDGVISLREAIAVAHEGDAITFAASLKGQTITLSGAEVALSQAITIDASALYDAENDVPGLTLDAGGLSRVFRVTGGTADAPVELIGLKITNGSDLHGGGLKVEAVAALAAKDCVFVDNKTTNTAGGGLCVDGWADLKNCVVSGNASATDGGGIYVASTGSLTATGLSISGNATTGQGGGLYVTGTTTLSNSTISGNSATWGGAAIIWGSMTMTNSLAVGNVATEGGGAFYLGGPTTIRNSTIAGNEAPHGGGFDLRADCSATLYNTIVAQNVATQYPGLDDVYDYGGTLSAYSVLSGYSSWDAGSYNYSYDASSPLFTDAANGDYTLAANSQAIDKGNNSYISGYATDLAGKTRVAGTSVDIGAYEYQQSTQLSSPSLSVSASSSSSIKATIESVSNASSYTLEYSTSSSFTSSTTVTKTGLSSGAYTIAGLKANTTYYVRVKAVGDGTTYSDSSWSSAKNATTPKIALSSVSLSGTLKVGATLTASVSPSGATATYQWYYGTSASSATTAISGATSAKFTLTSAYVGKYLKVVATGSGSYSGSVSKTTSTAVQANTTQLAAPSLSVSASSSSSIKATIGSVSNASSYTLEYSTSSSFTSSTTVTKTGLSSGAYTISGLSANTTYYVRVKAVGDGTTYSNSAWSSVKNATTPNPETPSLVVTTNSDVVNDTDGLISLREAIAYAEADSSLGSKITFATSLKGKTITLSGTQLTISKGITVDASALYDASTQTPGITVDANQKSRVFSVSGGTASNPVAFVGLKITGGKTSYGGGVGVYSGSATFTNSTISGNTSDDDGGGVCV